MMANVLLMCIVQFSPIVYRAYYQLLSLSFRDMDNIKLNEKQE